MNTGTSPTIIIRASQPTLKNAVLSVLPAAKDSPMPFTLVATKWTELQGNESWEAGQHNTLKEALAAYPAAIEGASRVIVKENGNQVFSISGDPKCPQLSFA